MASAWGKGWGVAWGSAWGGVTISLLSARAGGGGSSSLGGGPDAQVSLSDFMRKFGSPLAGPVAHPRRKRRAHRRKAEEELLFMLRP